MPYQCYDHAMARERISTTVDSDVLAQTRSATGLADAQLLDRALRALLREERHRIEIDALERQPYGPDVWLSDGETTDAAPWDGQIPDVVADRVRKRRKEKG